MTSQKDPKSKRTRMASADPFHKELFNTIMRSTSAIYWGVGGQIFHNGSLFFIETRNGLFAVTARHVYHAYVMAAREFPGLVCRIDDLRFDPIQRLMSEGKTVDIATFKVTPEELGGLGKLKMQ